MSAAARYHYDDFTRHNYRRLLRLAQQRYDFCSYREARHRDRFLIWRHDVDMSVHAAERLARIEADEGVAATYFLLVHSTYYNVFEKPIRDLVRSILRMGHHVGIHLDVEFHAVEREEQLDGALTMERRWLEDLFACPIAAFSMHDPTPASLAWRRWTYAGLINTYADFFQSEVGYCSDSNGYWRHRRLEDVLAAGDDRRLQVLTHPEWWTEEPMSPRSRVHRCIDGRAAALKGYYDRRLRLLQRENLGED